MASFDENGKYIKTNWKAGDKITATKLNKIEESIEAVNDNDISRHVEADARLDALEAKDVAHDKEFTNVKNTIANNKAAAELGDYEINSRMQFLEEELEEGIEEVHNVASTVDGKIAQAQANMTAQVNQGKADMAAMVAEVEADLEGLHAKDEELSEQLEHIMKLIIPHEEWEIDLINSLKSNTSIKLVGDFETDTLFNFNNMHNSRLEVKGIIKLNRSIVDFDQLFIFEDCSDLELVLNIDCNKSETRSEDYYPVIQFINCKNIVVTNSKLENIPYTGIGFVNSQNCIVKDSNFINFYDSGLNVGEGSINCIIKNNNFTCPDGLMHYGSHALNIYSRGVNTYGHLISGNNFYDIQSSAIQLTGRMDSDGNVKMDVTECIIENNIINYFGHNGVKLDGTGKNISINNNIFKNANVRPDGTELNHDCYGIFTSGQAGRAYSVDSIGNYFENCGGYSLRFSADSGDVMGYVNFKNNICINSPIFITPNSKLDTVDIVGNRIDQGIILLTNGLSTSTIRNINISYNIFKNYNQNGYCIYFVNNGCLRFSNNTIETLYASKNPEYIGYLSSTNMIVENNNIINIGGSDNKIRTVSSIIETCVFNGNINMDLYNQNDINTSYIKNYTKII